MRVCASASATVLRGVGDLTGDTDLQREGKLDQAVGTVKDKAEDAKDWVEDQVDKVKDKLHK